MWSLILSVLQAFLLKTIIFVLFSAEMCKTKSVSVTHMWVAGDGEESIIKKKIPNVLLLSLQYFCDLHVSHTLFPLHQTPENGLAGCFAMSFCSQT